MNHRLLATYQMLNSQLASKNDCEVLSEVVEYCFLNKVPIVEPDVAAFLTVLLRIRPAARILELGTGVGYSSLLFSFMCPLAEVVTFESDTECCAVAQKMFAKSTAHDRIRCSNTDISSALRKLTGKFDFVFIDADKESYRKYFSEIFGLLSDNAIVVADDVYFTGEVHGIPLSGVDPERIKRSLADYRMCVCNHSEFATTFIPIGCGVGISVRSRSKAECR